MAFQHGLVCIKTSHIHFPRTCDGPFLTTPIDRIRGDLPPLVVGVCGSPSRLGDSGVSAESQCLTPPLGFLNATDPTLSPPPAEGATASSTQRRL